MHARKRGNYISEIVWAKLKFDKERSMQNNTLTCVYYKYIFISKSQLWLFTRSISNSLHEYTVTLVKDIEINVVQVRVISLHFWDENEKWNFQIVAYRFYERHTSLPTPVIISESFGFDFFFSKIGASRLKKKYTQWSKLVGSCTISTEYCLWWLFLVKSDFEWKETSHKKNNNFQQITLNMESSHRELNRTTIQIMI